jgi:hypothetical protein
VTMHKRFLATTVLTVALLFSQVSNLLIASLCPHLRSGLASCEMQVMQPTVSHEHMGHEQMESIETESTSEQNADEDVLGQPTGKCPHCVLHSRTTTNAVSLKESEVAKRSSDAIVYSTSSSVAHVIASPLAVPSSRAHGPPGDNTPRHILINIFRI